MCGTSRLIDLSSCKGEKLSKLSVMKRQTAKTCKMGETALSSLLRAKEGVSPLSPEVLLSNRYKDLGIRKGDGGDNGSDPERGNYVIMAQPRTQVRTSVAKKNAKDICQ